MPPHRFLLVNAVCMGVDAATDHAIIGAFERGLVTTATLRYDGPTALSAVDLARTAHRNPDSCHAGFTLSEAEKEQWLLLGSFIPQPLSRAAALSEDEKQPLQRAVQSVHSLPLGLMLTLGATDTPPTSDAADDRSKQRRSSSKQARTSQAGGRERRRASSPFLRPLSSAQLEAAIKVQIDWFSQLTAYPPLFVLSDQQRHTSTPASEVLSRLLPLYGVHFVSAVEPALPNSCVRSLRRCGLAESRTAHFVFAEKGLRMSDADWEWTVGERSTARMVEELTASIKGLTELRLWFTASTPPAKWEQAQQRLLDECNAQQIVLVNHQQAAASAVGRHSLPSASPSAPVTSSVPLPPPPASGWHLLPNDLLHYVYAFLPPSSFILSRRVCRCWQAQALKPVRIWARLLFHVHPHLPASSLLRMSRSNLPMQRLRLEKKTVGHDSINSLQYLASLRCLTNLDLFDCSGVGEALTGEPSWVRELSSLQRLVLHSCDLSDEALGALAPLSALTHIDLSGSTVSHRGMAALCALHWPALVSLNLSCRHLPGPGSLQGRYSDETAVLQLLIDATPPVVGAKSFSDRALPALRIFDGTFPVFQARGPLWLAYVDLVHRFRRERPHIKAKTPLDQQAE